MTDRELLELAALAAGLHVKGYQFDEADNLLGLVVGEKFTSQKYLWNPLEDDGDALRLAVKLRMCVEPWGCGSSAIVFVTNRAQAAEAHYGDDPYAATRRAIVRAAAEIGKRIKEGV